MAIEGIRALSTCAAGRERHVTCQAQSPDCRGLQIKAWILPSRGKKTLASGGTLQMSGGAPLGIYRALVRVSKANHRSFSASTPRMLEEARLRLKAALSQA